MTVLIVDDEPRQAELMRRILEGAGYEAITAVSASEALDIFRASQTEIDLLVTDVVMPGTDGPGLAAQIRALKPDIRILFVSGFLAQYEWIALGAQASGQRFLAKPFSPSALIQEVKKTLAAGGKS